MREGDGRLGGTCLQLSDESLLPAESVDLPGPQTEGGDRHGVQPEQSTPTHPPLLTCTGWKKSDDVIFYCYSVVLHRQRDHSLLSVELMVVLPVFHTARNP